MEDCVHLVCESLGVREQDEVNVEKVCVLYQRVFLTAANLDDTQRAITQVRDENRIWDIRGYEKDALTLYL